MTPPAPALVTGLPVGSDIFVASNWMLLEVEDVAPEMVKFAVPIVPSGMTLAFIGVGAPTARHVIIPVTLLQVMVFAAAVAADPVVILTAETSFGGNANVHITPAT
jgi:hypothetical protein